ncbi:hypothetical protein HOM13_03650 [Candidatus Woesearchaeota archaeon]|nr:hypothetical protein [Candidatus Woesearchaeota archaeon]MBT5215803.1 hypothetical protein [Candidatus Woesearchaeota archaeon]MBT6402162.1 hypothetical protein [Candidatus Woesearchaeota archaeon]
MTSTKNIYRACCITAAISFGTMVSSPFLAIRNLETVVEQSPPVKEESNNSTNSGWLALFGASAALSIASISMAAKYGHKYDIAKLGKEQEFSRFYSIVSNPNPENRKYTPDPSKILI